MLPKNIYLDNQSTTPLDPRVLDAMLPYMTTHFGNPSSRTHTYGFKAEEAIINAKKQVAKLINCNYDELIVVSGATEANNLALKGLAEFKKAEFESLQKQSEIMEKERKEKRVNDINEMKGNNVHRKKDIENNKNNKDTENNKNNKVTENNKDTEDLGKNENNGDLGNNKNTENLTRNDRNDKSMNGCTTDKITNTSKTYTINNSPAPNSHDSDNNHPKNEKQTHYGIHQVGTTSTFDKRPHIITAQTEHKAVLDTLRNLSDDYRISYLPVLKSGHVDIDTLKKEITKNTICISLMGINNEIGTIQNTREIGKLCKDNGIVFHVDGAQSIGKIPIDVQRDNIGMLSISGHKIYGPKGIGMLYVRKRPRIRIKAQNFGGGQERNIRSGTLPTHLVVGLGKAAELAMKEMARDYKHIIGLSKELYTRLKKKIKDLVINGGGHENEQTSDSVTDAMEGATWYPGCLNISFPYVEGEGLLMRLKNVALSSGSACTSASLEPSYVLRALGQDEDLAHSSIRFGIGRFTTTKEIKKVAKSTVEAVKKLREMSPLYEMVNEGIDLKTIQWSGE